MRWQVDGVERGEVGRIVGYFGRRIVVEVERRIVVILEKSFVAGKKMVERTAAEMLWVLKMSWILVGQ